MVRAGRVCLALLLLGLAVTGLIWAGGGSRVVAERPVLMLGSEGPDVRLLKQRLSQWGYYYGEMNDVFDDETAEAVREFQHSVGIPATGECGPDTWQALGFSGTQVARPKVRLDAPGGKVVYRGEQQDLLARLISAEAEGEPYQGQVAVGAVIMNRIRDPRFPNSLSGVIFQPKAFESVSNGLIWRRSPSAEARRAARDAMNGADPTYGCVFFWNPAKPVGKWIWSRAIVVRIGKHVFAK